MVTNAYLYNGYTVTRNFVKNINACRKCGYRLYAKDDQQVRTGNGNINGNAIIVVRNIHYIKNLLKMEVVYMIISI